MDKPFAAFPSWSLRIECDRCGKMRMINGDAHTPAQLYANPRHPRQDAPRRLRRHGRQGGTAHRHRGRQRRASTADRAAGGVSARLRRPGGESSGPFPATLRHEPQQTNSQNCEAGGSRRQSSAVAEIQPASYAGAIARGVIEDIVADRQGRGQDQSQRKTRAPLLVIPTITTAAERLTPLALSP